jgi:hypothetical protein
LELLPKSEWIGDLKGAASVSQLVSEVRRRNATPSLSTNFSDAVEEYARQVAGGQAVPKPVVGLWPDLLDCLPVGFRKPLRDRLLNIAESKDGKFGEQFFALFGHEIALADDFHSRNAVSQIFAPPVRRKNAHGLAWLGEVMGKDAEMARIAAADDDFISRLQAHVDDDGERNTEADGHIDAIVVSAGVQPTHKAGADEDGEETAESSGASGSES